ncbi:hypothetical protein NQ317_019359 [Molorchus minor]|uniref:glutathione transferase n=1 Tax=Molorchus minor TaxID=1323400 RepID=A0ABQ9J919_9CUCU|nr:hypothetical protein NQ317_019359 [Molorchus minor]
MIDNKLHCTTTKENKSIKDAKAGPLFNETLPFYLEKLDSLVKKNDGYLVLGRLTWADVYFVAILDYLNSMAKKELIANYANLQNVKANVEAIPNVKAWIAKRPKDSL